jgi:hypothetical protein
MARKEAGHANLRRYRWNHGHARNAINAEDTAVVTISIALNKKTKMTLPLTHQVTSLETSKKMKEMGFPQESLWAYNVAGALRCAGEVLEWSEGWVAAYTLSEVIAMFGDKQVVIWRYQDKYHAGIYQYGSEIYVDDYPNPNEEGPTPLEAASALAVYLKENKLI